MWCGIHGKFDPDFDALSSLSTTNHVSSASPTIADRLSQLLLSEAVWQSPLTSDEVALFTWQDVTDLNNGHRLDVLNRPDGPIPAVFLGDIPPLTGEVYLNNHGVSDVSKGCQVGPGEVSTGAFDTSSNLLITKST